MKKNILLIQTAFLGDLILTTPLIREVKRLYPDSNLTVLVNKGTESVLEANPWIDQLVPLDKKTIKSSVGAFWKFTGELKLKKFDIVFSPHFSFRSSLIAWRTGAPIRIGYSSAGFSFLLTKKISRPLRGPHEVDKLLSLLYSQEQISAISKVPELFWKEESVRQIQLLMKQHGLEEKKFILLSPSSVWETKRMPADKFRKIGKELSERTDYRIVLTGGKSDFPLCEEVGEGYATNLAGKTSLPELSYLMSKAALLISNDSSPIHFASAFDIPTLAVFGATIPEFGYTPLASKQYISQIENLYCRPCGIHGGRVCPEKHFRCMLEQDTERIVREALGLLGSNR
ncbi:ADP-heptose--LPS heptosyltransferase [Leptospira perolatii]|uniref:ADP-heptose--LPS heptosyltransferase n=1 Tax=Leptospira perolatii TaxID=2023191 RepID=A0A2M9ZQ84_9LEPT|nr:glycosyltransferase family 9 protein [Leptospira perolatii]PJZ69002.1 ADP-heptose--LPS heptosyltransferase [Leptospira perolatii]PJZ74129.1 ADP-heptose--LPS heptosyltransferase [Leptospira perolatii]